MTIIVGHTDDQKRPFRSISRRFSFSLIGITTLVLIAFATMAILINRARSEDQLRASMTTYLGVTEVALRVPIWNVDYTAVQGFAAALLLADEVVYADVLENATPIAAATKDAYGTWSFDDFELSSDYMAGTINVVYEAEVIGVLRIAVSRAAVREAVLINAIGILALTLLMIAAISLTSVIATRRYVASPMSRLQNSASAIANGDLDREIPISQNDEIGRLADDFNTMRDAIKRLFGDLQTANATLERRVEERTNELSVVSERLGLAMSIDAVGVFDVDFQKETLWWSPEYIAMLGHDPETFVPNPPESWEERLYPDDAEAIIDEMQAFLDGRDETTRLRQHMLAVDNREIWIDAVMRVQRERDGTPTRLTGLAVDVTEQILREQALNRMAVSQREAREAIAQNHRELTALSTKLSKYLSPQVYDQIFSGRQEVKLASQRKKLTVFFSDIAGFTDTTDRLESEELTAILNQYLSAMTEIALQHGATIDKYMGDGLMIFFGDPETSGVREDALACLKMAIAMRERMDTLAETWRAVGIMHPLQCRIGINTGYCTVGNFGSDERMDYTIIGSTVNLAARLEQESEIGGILISYETYAHVKDHIRCEPAGELTVKGIIRPVAMYKVIGPVDTAGDVEIVDATMDHFDLRLDANAMSDTEREQARHALETALQRLRRSHAQ